jgi:hypothetical protein
MDKGYMIIIMKTKYNSDKNKNITPVEKISTEIKSTKIKSKDNELSNKSKNVIENKKDSWFLSSGIIDGVWSSLFK